MKLKRIVGLAVLSCLLSVTAEAAQINTIIDTGSECSLNQKKFTVKLMPRLKAGFIRLKVK